MFGNELALKMVVENSAVPSHETCGPEVPIFGNFTTTYKREYLWNKNNSLDKRKRKVFQTTECPHTFSQ